MTSMHPVSILKISTAALTVVVGLVCGILELKKNSKYWLNRFFSLFFMTSALGFFFYTLYHIILSNAALVIPFMITSQILFQLAMSFLLMTEFVVEFSEKAALSAKYLLISILLFLVFSIGYAIWVPTLNMEDYANGYVNTETPTFWFLTVFSYRIIIMVYVLYKFIRIANQSTGAVQKQMKFFAIGMIINISATLITLLGGISGIVGVILEIVGLLTFNIGVLVIIRGLAMKSSVK